MTGREAPQDPIQDEALDWLLKVEAAPDDARLRAALAAWRRRSAAHEKAYASVERMWRLAGDLPPDYDRAARPAASGTRRRVAFGAVAAAAAACLLLALAPTMLRHLEADHATGVGETRTVALEDGSRLQLGAESAVTVRYDAARRSVHLLDGQAYFDVRAEPDRPFTVSTDGLEVTVTGTSFAVGVAQGRPSVAVRSGTVEVVPTVGGGRAVVLGPGERVTVAGDSGALTKDHIAPADVAAWREGLLVVHGMPLAELAERLDRHHRGVILLHGDGLAERRVTGVFNLSDPPAALRAAAATHGAKVMALSPYLLVVRPR